MKLIRKRLYLETLPKSSLLLAVPGSVPVPAFPSPEIGLPGRGSGRPAPLLSRNRGVLRRDVRGDGRAASLLVAGDDGRRGDLRPGLWHRVRNWGPWLHPDDVHVREHPRVEPLHASHLVAGLLLDPSLSWLLSLQGREPETVDARDRGSSLAKPSKRS